MGRYRNTGLIFPYVVKDLVRACSSTPTLRSPHYYGQFALSLGEESPYIFSELNPFNTDTPLIGTLSMPPSVSLLTGFDCIFTLMVSSCSGLDPTVLFSN